MPAPTAPITTPNTMSHGAVSGGTGEARVGAIPMNSRVLSVSRKALLMRFLDFLLRKRKSEKSSDNSLKTRVLLNHQIAA